MSFELFVTNVSPAAEPWQSQCCDILIVLADVGRHWVKKSTTHWRRPFQSDSLTCMASIWYECAISCKKELYLNP